MLMGNPKNRVGDQTYISWIANHPASQKIELGFAPASPQTVISGITAKAACPIAAGGSGGNLSTTAAAVVSEPTPQAALHSDESGRLFLGGLVATRARLRFTGRGKIVPSFTWIDLHASKNANPQAAGFHSAWAAKKARSTASR